MASNGASNGAANPHLTHYPASNSPIGNIASLQDKVAIITGGSSGLGRAISQAYAAAGAYVVNADITPNPPNAQNIAKLREDYDLKTPTVDLINQKWPAEKQGTERAVFYKCDVTSEASVQGAVAFAVEKFGRLDIMVNNVGTLPATNLAGRHRWLFPSREKELTLVCC
jgi:NAD(P)-dependent dehydrogenase (short-subunit alcohol dehydrogenase family)